MVLTDVFRNHPITVKRSSFVLANTLTVLYFPLVVVTVVIGDIQAFETDVASSVNGVTPFHD